MKARLQTTGQEVIGRSNHPLYFVWYDMVRRCSDPNRDNYKYYGGRGISVCPRWVDSFADFVEDMGDRPKGFTLDRIDNNDNYTPENCRWTVRSIQQLNRRAYSKSGFKGVYWHKASGMWQAMDLKSRKTIGYFVNPFEAANAIGEEL